jgi:hypothetical protein
MRAAAVALLLALALASPARAFDDFEGTRALGMGGATRAWALGDSALLVNPSGMSLGKAYNIEGSYGYDRYHGQQFAHASIIDSTSASTLGGGLYYTYRADSYGPVPYSGHAHEAGAALSLPVGTTFTMGATLKWLRFAGDDSLRTSDSSPTTGGLTCDVGVTIRPAEVFSLAVVGANLVDRHSLEVRRRIGYGIAYLPTPRLTLVADGVTNFTRDPYNPEGRTSVRAGAELAATQRFIIRAGGGSDPIRSAGYLAAGLSAMSEVGAIDVGFQGDVLTFREGANRNVVVGISLRLFVPNAVTTAEAQPSP